MEVKLGPWDLLLIGKQRVDQAFAGRTIQQSLEVKAGELTAIAPGSPASSLANASR